MNDSEMYEIDLFGQKFVLSTNDGNKQELKKVADYFKKIVDDLISKLPNRPQLDIAVLAGLKIADKLYSYAKKKDKNINLDEEKIHEIVNDVIKRLDISLGL